MPPNYAMNAMAKDPSPEAAEALRVASRQIIYFVSAKAEDYPVKIGYSTHGRFSERLIQLQICMPYELDVMLVHLGGPEIEAELHERFHHLHLRGEWFKRGLDLLGHVAAKHYEQPDWELEFFIGKRLADAMERREKEAAKLARKRVRA